jgi:hypothetical protein
MAEQIDIGGSQGFAYVDDATGELVLLQGAPGTTQTNLRPASPDEIAGARAGAVAQAPGEKLAGLGEQVIGGATFGIFQSDSPEAQARSQVLGQENPFLKTTARVVGSLAPAALAGPAVGTAAGALGAGTRAAAVAAFVGEEVAQGLAFTAAEAAETDGNIDVGNVAQGLLEGAAFLGFGKAISRLARGRKAAQATEAVADSATGLPADAVARADAATTQAAKLDAVKPTRAEVVDYAKNAPDVHRQVDDLAVDAGNRAFGENASFTRAHNIGFKRQDIAGKMTDANVGKVVDDLETQAEALEGLAAKLTDETQTSAVAPGAARVLRREARRLRQARAGAQVDSAWASRRGSAAEEAAIASDQAKRVLDDLRSQAGSPAAKARDPHATNVGLIDEVLEPLRKDLEDAAKWGKNWAEKQSKENALWSGREGIINSRAIWQDEMMEGLPGAAGRARTAGRDVPVSVMKDGLTDRLLALGPSKRKRVIQAMENDINKTIEMSKLKLELGGAETRAAVSEVMKDLEDFRAAVQEAKRVAQLNDTGGALIKKIQARKPLEEAALETLEKVPGAGIAARALRGTIEEARTPLADTAVRSADELRAAIEARQAARSRPGGKLSPRAQGILDRIRARRGQSGSVALTGSRSPVSLEGLTLRDLDALDDVTTMKQETLAALRTGQGGVRDFAKEFASTGRVKEYGAQQGIQIEMVGGKPRLRDGRHRLTVAREQGRETVYGQVYDGARAPGKKPIFEGEIPIGPGKKQAGHVQVGREGRDFTLGDIAKSPMGVVTGAGAAGVGLKELLEADDERQKIAAETLALRSLDQHSKDTTERAMLQLGTGETERRPSAVERFRGEFTSLSEAFEAKVGELRRITEDPAEFIARVTQAFEPLANAGHPELASKLVTRLMVGAQYLLENAPPPLGVSMFNPEGSTPDEIAVLQFAPVWEAVFRPTDTVRDFANKAATPSAMRAIREVHPDVYTRVMSEAFRTLAAVGPGTDFETKRYLDNVLQMGPAVGASFSPSFSNLMASARQQATPPSSSPPNNSVAPDSANAGFSKGPTAIR